MTAPTTETEGRTFSHRLASGAVRCIREPLVHFLLIGAALFAVYAARHPAPEVEGRANRIELTADDLRQLELTWMATWRRTPTPDEMRGLIDLKVREEVLYREAMAMGLDKDDAIVKRRLAQKWEFLSEDVSALATPSDAELRAWFAANGERFALPGRMSFSHVYFSPDRRGSAGAKDAAAAALPKLTGPDAGPAVSDRFMFQDAYPDRAFEDVAKVFGSEFARSLAPLKPGAWHGPIESGYGWHLVRVESTTPGRVPGYDEVAADVREQWLAVRRTEARAKAFDAMRARYEVVLPKTLTDAAAVGGAGTPVAKGAS